MMKFHDVLIEDMEAMATNIFSMFGINRGLICKVKVFNPSNHLPYHNYFHLLNMVISTHHIAQKYDYDELPRAERKALFVAALFHDYDHSGGKQSDACNIAKAINGMRKFVDDENLVKRASELIMITEYPFKNKPICLAQKIIRDCDLLQAYTHNGVYHTSIRLFKELKDAGKLPEGTTLADGCDMQVDFLSNATLYTEHAKAIREKYLPKVKKELRELKELM